MVVENQLCWNNRTKQNLQSAKHNPEPNVKLLSTVYRAAAWTLTVQMLNFSGENPATCPEEPDAAAACIVCICIAFIEAESFFFFRSQPSRDLTGWKMKPTLWSGNNWTSSNGCLSLARENESASVDSYVKMSRFTAEIAMFTAGLCSFPFSWQLYKWTFISLACLHIFKA